MACSPVGKLSKEPFHDFDSKTHLSFILGIVEAPFYPGAIYMISQFYTRKEAATRMALFYTGNLLASSFAGLIAAGVFAGLDGKHGMYIELLQISSSY